MTQITLQAAEIGGKDGRGDAEGAVHGWTWHGAG